MAFFISFGLFKNFRKKEVVRKRHEAPTREEGAPPVGRAPLSRGHLVCLCNIPNFQFEMLYNRSSLHSIFYCILVDPRNFTQLKDPHYIRSSWITRGTVRSSCRIPCFSAEEMSRRDGGSTAKRYSATWSNSVEGWFNIWGKTHQDSRTRQQGYSQQGYQVLQSSVESPHRRWSHLGARGRSTEKPLPPVF